MSGAMATACSNNTVDTQITASQTSSTSLPVNTENETFTGFITAEDDFVDPQIGVDPSKDTRGMILMNLMARSGLGLAVQESGSWEFYYFSGKFATTINPAFDGTGGQLMAWNTVLNTKKQDHIAVTVTGTLNGDSATNPGPDADGIFYPVITVNTMVES